MTESTEATGGPVMESDWRADLRSRLRDRFQAAGFGPIGVHQAAAVASEFIEPLQADLVAAETRILELTAERDHLNGVAERAGSAMQRFQMDAIRAEEDRDEAKRRYADARSDIKAQSWQRRESDARILKLSAELDESRETIVRQAETIARLKAEALQAPAEHSSATETADVYLGASRPELREVPAEDAQEGDTVTIVGRLDNDRELGGSGAGYVCVSGDDLPAYRRSSNFLVMASPSITITRPVAPLPTKMGSVGTATVLGVDHRFAVMLVDSGGDHLRWVAEHGSEYRAVELVDFRAAEGQGF